MAKLVKIVVTLRNNWKKSVVGFSALGYGIDYIKDKYDSFQLMRLFSEEAALVGALPLPVGLKPRQVTVLLNPAANKRKAKANFEEYCAPLLYLAGISVNVIYTEHEGQVRTFLETYNEATDAIVVGGGDGTLAEAVTGLLRRPQVTKCPVGILPLGRTNTVATSLFSSGCTNSVHFMAKSTMAIIKEVTKPIDVVKVEVLEEVNGAPVKPVYSLGGIHWGAFRDANAKRDVYWYWGGLRSYATYVFTGYKSNAAVSWECEAEVDYVLPCSGCSKCYEDMPTTAADAAGGRWWHAFLPRKSQPPAAAKRADYSKIQNQECGILHREKISTVDLSILTRNVCRSCCNGCDPHIDICIGPKSVGYLEFIAEGWRRVRGKEPTLENKLAARKLELRPVVKKYDDEKVEKAQEHWLSIDLDDYEVKPIRLTLLPEEVEVFCAS